MRHAGAGFQGSAQAQPSRNRHIRAIFPKNEIDTGLDLVAKERRHSTGAIAQFVERGNYRTRDFAPLATAPTMVPHRDVHSVGVRLAAHDIGVERDPVELGDLLISARELDKVTFRFVETNQAVNPIGSVKPRAREFWRKFGLRGR